MSGTIHNSLMLALRTWGKISSDANCLDLLYMAIHGHITKDRWALVLTSCMRIENTFEIIYNRQLLGSKVLNRITLKSAVIFHPLSKYNMGI